jgi:gamma-glutamylcyclotransferase (GGCT)/AIG2-like uncharacterized protein YtfP
VVLKNFNFPSIEDFEHNTTVTKELPELRLTNYRHYDVWIYLGVLPGKGEMTTRVYTILQRELHIILLHTLETQLAHLEERVPGNMSKIR